MYASILVALDGSPDSLAGGRLALCLARQLGCSLLCVHAYDARIHNTRFEEMEPGLPARYQDPEYLAGLRTSHDSLISEGFEVLSRGYMEAFLAEVRRAGVVAEELVAAGRNYVELLRLAGERRPGLVVLGATGLGAVGDGQLGSTALRVLRRAAGDVLLARAGASPDGDLLVGIDGSPHALGALRVAQTWARCLGRPLRLAAAFDPLLHQSIFRAMAQGFPEERREAIGLERQEQLHEELIDDGLGKLYQVFLDQARERAQQAGISPSAVLLEGKAYRALLEHAGHSNAGLLVLGRFGHNREPISDLGSNAEAVARLFPGHVLVTAGAEASPAAAEEAVPPWDDDALAALERVPSFARPMARKGVEARAQQAGRARVTRVFFDEVARSLGMGGPGRGPG